MQFNNNIIILYYHISNDVLESILKMMQYYEYNFIPLLVFVMEERIILLCWFIYKPAQTMI